MKTIHTYLPADPNRRHSDFVTNLLYAVFNNPKMTSHVRIIECGSGIVILPDTNRKQDCEKKEIVKALGLLGEIEEEKVDTPNEGKTFMFCDGYDYDGIRKFFVQLTPEQVRLLDWLKTKDVFCDSVTFTELNKLEFETI